ncbi:hypothetical protein [Parvularcula maris]|uniref:hypothetical protein n=1 Tax=Parvularcula maris TaxID=2965077 RepID=UPI002114C489|nr:hypothetical protein [Parvularcula maris]
MNAFALIRAGLVASGLVGAAVLGRKAIDNQIKRKMSDATVEAVRLAEEELDRSVQSVMRERITQFLRTTAVKFLLLGIVVAFFAVDFLSLAGLRVAVVGLGVSYIAFDLKQSLPQILPAVQYARKHRFRTRSMVTDAVAAAAFEKAYEQAQERLSGQKGQHWITLSSYNHHDLSSEIAEAVAEVARHASYDKVKPRALLFGGFCAVLSLTYAGIAFFLVHMS